MTSIHSVPLTMLDGRATTFGEFAGRAVLVVNVASKCGLTPQYAGLETLAETYADRGLTVLGAPVQPVRGAGARHQRGHRRVLLDDLRRHLPADRQARGQRRGSPPALRRARGVRRRASGHTGDVRWNFEKWLVSPEGEVVGRWSPQTQPDDAALVSAVEAALPA